jgi:hypothetical protein
VPTHRSYLVLGTALAISVILAVLAALYGTDRDGLTLLLRASARMSFAMFLLWLALPALGILRPGRLPEAAAAEPHLLMAFAVAHTIHVGVIVFATFQGYFAQITEDALLKFVIGGGSAYLMIVLMGLTALRAPSRPRALLRSVGGIYVGLVFLNSYVGRVREGDMLNLIGVAALVLAAAIRLAAWRAQRAGTATHAAGA